MAPDWEGEGNTNAVSSKPLTEETTTTKEHKQFTTSSETLTPPSLPSSTSNPPPSLPFDLEVEILFRLPVKPLLRFCCVCKPWKSLISDPKFAKKHLRCSRTDFTRHHLIINSMNRLRESVFTVYPLPTVFNAVTTATQLEYPLRDETGFGIIAGSCNGILCINIDHLNFALLWNPFTHKFKKLPSLENPEGDRNHTRYDFGYDHLADRYKVFAFFFYQCDDGDRKVQGKVHTLGTDSSWRSIQEFPAGVPGEPGILVSGTLNWLRLSIADSKWFVVSLDLGKESYQELMPVTACYGELYVTLGVLRDCLCTISKSRESMFWFWEVWVMKEYGNNESWTKLFNIRGLGRSYPKILHMSEDDQVLLEINWNYVLYNSRDDTSKTTQIRNTKDLLMVSDTYVESLISPCSLY